MKYQPDHVYGVLFNTKTHEISRTYNSFNKAESVRREMASNGSISKDVITKGVKFEFIQ